VPGKRDRRPGFRAKNRDIAALGALDHDIGLGRAQEIQISDVRDFGGDRIPDLRRPVRAIQHVAGVR
jgi:hypothetical protein